MDEETISYTRMCELIKAKEFDINETSKDLVKNPQILKDKVNEKYKFIKRNVFFKIFSFLFYVFAYIVLLPTLFIYFLPRIKGRKNLKKIKNAVFVSNHCFVLDCAMLEVFAFPFKRPYMLAQKNAFQIPVVRGIIRSLRAVPVPENMLAYKNFMKSVDEELKNGKSLYIAPEGSLWPYFPRIRPFKNGAFRFAIKNDLPIVPVVLSFRKPNWFYRMFGRKKPLININILEPVYPDKENSPKLEELKLNDRINKQMINSFERTNSYIFINQKRLEKEKKNIKNA